MNTNTIKTMFGCHKDAKVSPGLKDLYFGSPENAYRQVVGPDGNVLALQKMPPLRPEDYVLLHLPIVAQVGLPFVTGFLDDASKPEALDVMYWRDVAEKAMATYPSKRGDFKKHPVAGMALANFLLKLAPEWAKKSNTPVDFERFRPELDLIEADDEHVFRRSPEVLAIAKARGIDVPPTREREMLP